MSFRVKVHLSYDGTQFSGWQKQKSGQRTVQGEVEKTLSRLFSEPVRVVGSSRTDAGVHARYQIIHFDVTKDPRTYKLLRGINALLPEDIVAHTSWLAPDDFHAIASTTRKTYKYLVWHHRYRNPLKSRFTVHMGRPLDVGALNLLSRELVGEHDFKSFQTTGSVPSSTVRTVDWALWRRKSPHLLEFSIRGSGFLKQMVRNIVGTCFHVHFQGWGPAEMREILNAQSRARAWGTAPAHGLHLWHIEYPKDLDKKCLKI